MNKKKILVKKITSSNFSRFGWLIDYPQRNKASGIKNLFRVVVRQPNNGWRIAYLVVREKFINKMEKHPGSLESFEPVEGRGLIYVASKRSARDIECFLLDKPVILKKGIWHGVITLSQEFDVKITENSKVRCVYWPLEINLNGK